MVKKLHKTDTPESTEAPGEKLKASVRDSAQQIWQAGLGAFAKAQAEGTRAFESLVKEGTSLQRKTQAAAEERINEAASKMTNMASDISSKATGHWDKLETIFEDRVAKALGKLGVPSAKDVDALHAQIDELKQTVHKMSAAPRSAPRKAETKDAPARKAPAKPVAKAATKVAPRAAAKRKAPRTGA